MKPKKNKRQRTSTASEQSRILAAAFAEIKPPAGIRLQPLDKKFFDCIIAEQANADWTDHQIHIAAFLARAMGNLEREESLLRNEGMIHKTKNKYPILNHRKAAVQLYATLILAYRKTLCLHVRVIGVNAADAAARKKKVKEIEGLAQDFDDDLIARPGRAN